MSDAEPRDEAATRGDAPATPGDAIAGGDATAAPADTPPDALARGYSRSRAKTEAIQAGLKPLGPDERPLGIKLAVALALLIAAATLLAVALGAGDESPAVGVVWAALMCALAAGLWARVYLVVLLFQALLAITIIVATLALAFASNLAGVVLALGLILACSPIFWLLIRVMARLQVPRG